MRNRALLVCVALLSSGCAQLTHFKSDLHNPETGVSVDIKQRMMFKNQKVNGGSEYPRICAEPSPDAISSLGASLGASVLRPSGSTAQLTSSISESAAFVGLRTQSIQLMRDAMYRACEAYMSGAIEPEEYLLLQRRFQAQVVGLLAIEQLTGTVAAQPVTVHTNAAATAGGNVSAEAEKVADARKQLASEKVKLANAKADDDKALATYAPLKTAAEKLTGKSDDALTDAEKKTKSDAKEAQIAKTRTEEQLALAKELVKLYEELLATAELAFKQAQGRVSSSASGGASTPLAIVTRPVSDTAITKVAESVVQIVGKIFNDAFDDNTNRCLAKLYAAREPAAQQFLVGVCAAFAAQQKAVATKELEDAKLRAENTAKTASSENVPQPKTNEKKGSTQPGAGKVSSGAKTTPPAATSPSPAAAPAPVTTAPLATERAKVESASQVVEALKNVRVPAVTPPPSAASSAGQ